ncbi:MAG: AI-2E family transporter [Anaerolineales bacterium]|nr:MAG: AI-2E family transporter [Anaerolineales bacterium]
MSPKWQTPTKYIVLLLVIVAVIATVNFARPLIGPLVISALLAFVLTPLVERLAAHRRLQRNTAVLIVYLLFIALSIAIPSSIIPFVIPQLLNLSFDLLEIEQQIEAFFNQTISIGGFSFSMPALIPQDLNQLLEDFILQISSGAFNMLGTVTSNLAWLLVILVATFYFLKDSARLSNWMIGLAPQAYQEDMRKFLAQMNRIWGAFLRGQLILVLIITLSTAISMSAVGLRGAIGIGILAGILDLIPSLGPLVAGVIAGLIALIFGSSYLSISNLIFAIIVGVIFFVIQQVENIWLRPQIMGQTLRLHPGLVFVGVIGALALSGILGALVIIPLMATIGVLLKYIQAKLRDEPPWQDDIIQLVEKPIRTKREMKKKTSPPK